MTMPMKEMLALLALDDGEPLSVLLQGAWNVMIDDQPEEQADRLIIDGETASWNGQPVPVSFEADAATIDHGIYHYEIRRYYADKARTDRFDANLVVAPGEKIMGQMDRVRVGKTGPRIDIRSGGLGFCRATTSS